MPKSPWIKLVIFCGFVFPNAFIRSDTYPLSPIAMIFRNLHTIQSDYDNTLQHRNLEKDSSPIGDKRTLQKGSSNIAIVSELETVSDFDLTRRTAQNVLNKPLMIGTSSHQWGYSIDAGYNYRYRGRYIGPGPVVSPWPKTCREMDEDYITGTLPPDVCDRCPVTAGDQNPLDPCICVGNTGNAAGMISITCPNTIKNEEQLEEILTAPDYLTTQVFRFTLRGSNVTGAIRKSLWGDLAFHQVVIEGNQFQFVDNKAFVNSAETITYLSLYNNRIIQYYSPSTKNELPYLEVLILKGNEIPFIFSNAFSYKNLRVLDLSFNIISSIGQESFAELEKLEELYLNDNQLTKLEDNTFKFTSHLPASNFLQIDLSNNNISFINDNAFADLYNVQINLQNNKLTTISESIFKHILLDSQYFAVIYISDNPIVCDCDIKWIVEDSHISSCFDNFFCTNLGLPILAISVEDLGNCTTY